MCVQLDITFDKTCPFCIMLILWSQMNKISLIRLMQKALHKMQSDRKRTGKGNPVPWRLRHFSWQSRVTSAAVIISVFYIYWKKKPQLSGETDAETQLRLTDLLLQQRVLLHIPAPQSDRRRVWTYISDIQVSILITELSDFFPFSYLERLTTYQFSDVLESNQWGFGLNKPLFLPSSLTGRASVCLHLQTSWEHGTFDRDCSFEVNTKLRPVCNIEFVFQRKELLQKYLGKQCFCWNVLC